MRLFYSIFSLRVTVLLILLVLPHTNSLAQSDKTTEKISSESPIVIQSDSLEVDQQKKLIIFEGKVRAKREDMVVDCQKMIVYYLDSAAKSESSIEAGRIDKIVALGNVTIDLSDGTVARAGKAVFYQNEQKAVLTGNPSARRGSDLVEGHQITIYLNENRSIIEGSGTKRVKATIFPKEEEER